MFLSNAESRGNSNAPSLSTKTELQLESLSTMIVDLDTILGQIEQKLAPVIVHIPVACVGNTLSDTKEPSSLLHSQIEIVIRQLAEFSDRLVYLKQSIDL